MLIRGKKKKKEINKSRSKAHNGTEFQQKEPSPLCLWSSKISCGASELQKTMSAASFISLPAKITATWEQISMSLKINIFNFNPLPYSIKGKQAKDLEMEEENITQWSQRFAKDLWKSRQQTWTWSNLNCEPNWSIGSGSSIGSEPSRRKTAYGTHSLNQVLIWFRLNLN